MRACELHKLRNFALRNANVFRKFIFPSCGIVAGRRRDQSAPPENAPSDFSSAARRSGFSATDEVRFSGNVSTRAQIFPALQLPPFYPRTVTSVRNSN